MTAKYLNVKNRQIPKFRVVLAQEGLAEPQLAEGGRYAREGFW